MNESSEYEIQRLYSRLNLSDLKLADLLFKVQKFSNDLLTLLESWKLPVHESEKIQSDLNHFLSIQDISSPSTLFLKFKQELLERLNCRDSSKESLKTFIISGISELNTTTKLSVHHKRKSLNILEDKQELTPVRNIKRSSSPGERLSCSLMKENCELKVNLSEVLKERDLLKVWRDNLIKHPNLDLDMQKIVKDLKEESDLNAVKSQCFMSKLNFIVTATYKFLNNTSKFQKVVRGGEGYPSCNFYDDEKARLEAKLREVIENNENSWKPPHSPLRTNESERRFLRTPDVGAGCDIRKKSRELPVYYNEKINNKLIEEITKQYTERIDHLSSTVTKLETDNRKLKNKYFLVKKEMKAVKTSENQKKVEIFETFFQKQSVYSSVFKKSFVRQFNFLNTFCEKLWQSIQNSLEEKSLQISSLKCKLFEVIQQKNTILESLTEKSLETTSKLKSDYENHIENLEKSLSEQRQSSQNALKSLEKNLNDSEAAKKKLELQVKSLEAEISVLSQEKKNWKDAQKIVFLQKEKITLLELKAEENSSLAERFEKNEEVCDKLKTENNLLRKDLEKLTNTLEDKSNELEKLVNALVEGSKEKENIDNNLKDSKEIESLVNTLLKNSKDKEKLASSLTEKSTEMEKLVNTLAENSKEKESLAITLADKSAELESIVNTLAEISKEKEKLTNTLTENLKEKEILTNNLTENLKEKEKLAITISEISKEKEKLTNTLAENSNENEKLTNILAENLKEKESLAITLADKLTELENLVNTLAETSKEKEKLTNTLSENSKEKERLTKTLAENSKEKEIMANTLAEKSKELEKLVKTLSVISKEKEKLVNTLAENFKEKEKLATTLEYKLKEIEDLQNLLEEANQRIKDLDSPNLSGLDSNPSNSLPDLPDCQFKSSPLSELQSNPFLSTCSFPPQSPSSKANQFPCPSNPSLQDSSQASLKSALIFAEMQKELSDCELLKIRSTYQKLESFLHHRLIHSPSAPLYMSRLDLTSYSLS
jgi:chromosome segregation ATPase